MNLDTQLNNGIHPLQSELLETIPLDIEAARTVFKSHGILCLTPDQTPLDVKEWGAIELHTEPSKIPYELVEKGDVGEPNCVHVCRFLKDVPEIELVNRPLSDVLLHLLNTSKLVSYVSSVVERGSLEICACQAHIINTGGFIGFHVDKESNPELEAFAVLHLSEGYEGGQFKVHHPEEILNFELLKYSMLVGDTTIGHEVTAIENGSRRTLVAFFRRLHP